MMPSRMARRVTAFCGMRAVVAVGSDWGSVSVAIEDLERVSKAAERGRPAFGTCVSRMVEANSH